MKIYQVSVQLISDDEHRGYDYLPSLKAAKRSARTLKKTHRTTITILEVKPTKAGIISLLNRYASHPDNG
jgi:hypothetical protein